MNHQRLKPLQMTLNLLKQGLLLHKDKTLLKLQLLEYFSQSTALSCNETHGSVIFDSVAKLPDILQVDKIGGLLMFALNFDL
jgi:uncharacterized Rmd1/YagE family protein